MTTTPRLLAAALLLAAAPVLAQTTTTPAPAPGTASATPRGYVRDRPGPMQMMHGGMFKTLSPAGKATMREAMKGDMAARQAEREAVKAARDRMLAVLEAERLDIAALKKAMADERAAANAGRERMQASMAAAFAKLSVADRRAFVTEARQMRTRMEERMKGWKKQRRRRHARTADAVLTCLPPPCGEGGSRASAAGGVRGRAQPPPRAGFAVSRPPRRGRGRVTPATPSGASARH